MNIYINAKRRTKKIEFVEGDLLPNQSVVSFEMDTKHKLTEGDMGCDFSYLYQCIMGTGTLDIVLDADS